MSTRQDSILESGQWDEKKQDFTLSTLSAAKWCLELLRPAIFTRTGPRKQTKRATHLDGLRGFAALIVYWQHHQLWPRPAEWPNRIMENAYGYQDQYYFACLPGIRTFFTGGHFAVAVFFIISGYVLSAKPLSLIYAGEHAKLGDNLASALFRRWLRLFLPVIGLSFVYMTSWHAFGIWTNAPEHQSNYRDEFWTWYREFVNFSFLFKTGDTGFRYNFPTWSIPVEFRGSIVVYTTLLAFSRSTKNARLMCEAGLIFYFLYIVDGWFCAMFIAGLLLCELELLAKNSDLPGFLSRLEPYKVPIYYTLFGLSIYLGGVPSHQREPESLEASPGWYYLSYLRPEAMWDYKWLYLFLASVFLVSSIPHIWWLQSFFENRFNQYLGRISFALYLVHGPVLWILGDRLYAATGWHHGGHEINTPNWIDAFPLSQTGPLGLELCFLAPHVILLPLTLWLAEIVTKIFDEPSVKFSQWAYELTLAPSAQLL